MTDLPDLRVGVGTDVHPFSSDQHRPMTLACLTWPGEIGLEGHSDADVVAHAACDAMLSAARLGDMGSNFGTSQPRWAGASGAEFLTETMDLIRRDGWHVSNLAIQIIGNRPRVGERRTEAEDAVGKVVGAPVSISATTTDGLGFTGRDEGVAAIATALLIAGRR